MTTKLLLAPAGGGKTQAVVNRIRAVLAEVPLGNVWAIVPDRHQLDALQKRIAAKGALGVHAATFGDLYREILIQAGEPFPVTPEPVIRRLIRAAIDDAALARQLSHYGPIQHRPGLVSVLADLFAELKRAGVAPERFLSAVAGRDRRLEELALLYEQYQDYLIRLGWSDHEGLGWLAVQALERGLGAIRRLPLLAVDGFDSFNQTQLRLLEALKPLVDEMLLTLTGDIDMTRPAYRRFGRTLALLQEHLSLDLEMLPPRQHPVPALGRLESMLFERGVPPVPSGASVTFVEAQTMALEAREALRWLKARIVRNGVKAGQCAIVARDISAYRSFLREAAREFGLPLRLSCGEPLALNPAVAAILNLLELPLRNWRRRALLDVLRSPYLDLSSVGLSSADAWRFDEIARLGQVVEGLDQWEEALALASNSKGAPDDEMNDETSGTRQHSASAAASCARGLRALINRLTPAARASARDHVSWVQELLFSPESRGLLASPDEQEETAARDQLALSKFATSLDALVLADSVLVQRPSDLSYEAFAAELRSVVDGATYRLEKGAGRAVEHVYATNISDARGVRYRAVAVLGLSEGLLPSPLSPDPLLSEEEREYLVKAGLPLEPKLRSDQQSLFYEAVTRATEFLLLTRPYLADDGEVWEASPYWAAARSLFPADVVRPRPEDTRPPVDAASVPELLAWCVQRRGLPKAFAGLGGEWEMLREHASVLVARLDTVPVGGFEGDVSSQSAVLADRYGSWHVWSASRLETYLACPFQFFVSAALRLEERKAPAPGFDAAQLGLTLHEILERLYREAGDPTNLEDLLAILPAIADSVLAAAPTKYGFRPTPLWENQRAELLEWTRATLQGLAAQKDCYRPAYFELGFGFHDQPPLAIETNEGVVQCHGVIDRIDVDPSGRLRVIDYKTGSAGLHPLDLVAGRRLQLAIYALAAEQVLGLGEIADGFYWAIKKAQISQLKLCNFRHQSEGHLYQGPRGAMELAAAHITSVIRGVRTGAFPPAPSDGCKGYCPPRSFCWRYHPKQW